MAVGNFQPSLFPNLSYSPDNTIRGRMRTRQEMGGLLTQSIGTLPFAGH